MSRSYVIGNSWQIRQLTHAERAALDEEPWVFACNLFPSNWRMAGFRPSVWVMGDTETAECQSLLRKELDAIRSDDHFRQRLKHIFICAESPEAREIVEKSGLPITLYRRGHSLQEGQQLAREISEQVYHHISTLTDLVNFAWILNPQEEVRLYGCQYLTGPGHFYSPEYNLRDRLLTRLPRFCHELLDHRFCGFTTLLWQALADLRRQGVDLIDSNRAHGHRLPIDCQLPRKPFIDGVSTSNLDILSPGWGHFGIAWRIRRRLLQVRDGCLRRKS